MRGAQRGAAAGHELCLERIRRAAAYKGALEAGGGGSCRGLLLAGGFLCCCGCLLRLLWLRRGQRLHWHALQQRIPQMTVVVAVAGSQLWQLLLLWLLVTRYNKGVGDQAATLDIQIDKEQLHLLYHRLGHVEGEHHAEINVGLVPVELVRLLQPTDLVVDEEQEARAAILSRNNATCRQPIPILGIGQITNDLGMLARQSSPAKLLAIDAEAEREICLHIQHEFGACRDLRRVPEDLPTHWSRQGASDKGSALQLQRRRLRGLLLLLILHLQLLLLLLQLLLQLLCRQRADGTGHGLGAGSHHVTQIVGKGFAAAAAVVVVKWFPRSLQRQSLLISGICCYCSRSRCSCSWKRWALMPQHKVGVLRLGILEQRARGHLLQGLLVHCMLAEILLDVAESRLEVVLRRETV